MTSAQGSQSSGVGGGALMLIRNHLSLYDVTHCFCYVGRVIAHPFEIFSAKGQAQAGRYVARIFEHVCEYMRIDLKHDRIRTELVAERRGLEGNVLSKVANPFKVVGDAEHPWPRS